MASQHPSNLRQPSPKPSLDLAQSPTRPFAILALAVPPSIVRRAVRLGCNPTAWAHPPAPITFFRSPQHTKLSKECKIFHKNILADCQNWKIGRPAASRKPKTQSQSASDASPPFCCNMIYSSELRHSGGNISLRRSDSETLFG